MNIATSTLIAVLFICFSTGCKSSLQLPVGDTVIIQFDRSSLGSAASLPVPPTTQIMNGASTAIRGTLRYADAEWLKVEREDSGQSGQTISTFWIPRDKVLLIQRDAYHAK